MAAHWRRLALAAFAAVISGALCATTLSAQSAKSRSKKATPPQAAAGQSDAEGDKAEGDKAGAAKKKKTDPAEAQRAVDHALKLLESGKSEQAVQALSNVLAAGSLPPTIMAKAMLYRGIAYRQQKKPALAISDLTSALWLKGGLSESERADTLKQRASAYQEAGLSETGQPLAAAEAPSTSARRERTASAGNGWSAATTASLAQGEGASAPATSGSSSSGGGWNFFNNLFNGGAGSSASAPAPQTTASIPRSENTPHPQRTATSAWASNTQVHGAAPTPAAAPAVASVAPPPVAKPTGRFRIQLANVRSQEEALAMAHKVKREHAVELASREPEIDQAVLGNMGSFYRVRIGPFATQAESQAICGKLKSSGVDCLVITH